MKKTVITCVVATVPVLLIVLAASAWWNYANWLVTL
jgi:hypothetical protein